ncbi:hypothetical protein KEU06_00810 [Pseudaminobacter sp. 19-2017]|uniref:Uncharacterized protein n=1 Tax=Pseudaminobacter soli (ex Zhang et al. 2022) TaxID=2831468 RepID=A0A942I6C5_9HYPH|nr:hypothetical protein [Pseudaminobacter soli]MBS3647165.1 hypothetical protein [Pseudaminobacter soli]
MEIAPTMPLAAAELLPNATAAGLDINVAAAAGTGSLKPAVNEWLSVTTNKIAGQKTTPTTAGSEPAQLVQNIQDMRTGNNGVAGNPPAPVEAVKEFHLYEYMDEAGKRGAAGADPSALFDSTIRSLGGMVESAQGAMGSRQPGATQAPTANDAGDTGQLSTKMGEADMQRLLDQYVSASWALFGASLATNSVSAAASSVNTLIKQQ